MRHVVTGAAVAALVFLAGLFLISKYELDSVSVAPWVVLLLMFLLGWRAWRSQQKP
jgi:hypothetical protein